MFDATPLFRLYAIARTRSLARLDPVVTQERQLRRLVLRACATRFGHDHDFGRIRTVTDFQARVPLRRYEDMWRDYWQPAFPVLWDVSWPGLVPYFAASSGTTSGASKNIPVTHPMIHANQQAALDTLAYHVLAHPAARPLGGKTFMLGGSTDLKRLAPGVYSGDLSGIAAKTLTLWAQGYTFPRTDLALIADWDEKIAVLSEKALEEPIRAVSGTPSWVLMVFKQMERLRRERGDPRPAFPELELYIHGGVSFAPYRALFAPLLEATGATTREVYPASEGFIALQDLEPEDGLALILDNGLFFEFVPVEELDEPAPTRHWIATAEPGVNYALVLSSNAGVWSYVLGDTVRLVNLSPPRLVVTGRTSYMLSAFGEHLIGEEIEAAVLAAAEALGLKITDFSVGPIFPERPGEPGRHLYVVECDTPPEPSLARRFAGIVDDTLRELNDDYRTDRDHATGVAPPEVVFVPPGAFAQWMRARGRLGGQNKVPRVLSDPEKLAELRAFMADIS